jgi:hypothetical protein
LFTGVFRSQAQGNGQKSAAQLMLGTWSFDLTTSMGKMTTESKTFHAKMDANRQSRLTRAYEGRSYTFNENGTFVQQLGDGRQFAGKWSLVDNEQVLQLISPQGAVSLKQIGHLSTNKMVLLPPNVGKMKSMFAEWHLTKK